MKTCLFASACLALSTVVASALPLPPVSPQDEAARLALFDYPPLTDASSIKSPDSDNCIEHDVQIPIYNESLGKNELRTVRLSLPSSDQKAPVVLIIPSIVGVQITEHTEAARLCEVGIATIITDFLDNSPYTQIPGWGTENQRVTYAVRALRTTLDYAQSNPRLDGSRMGVMGISMGGIMSAFMAGVDSRVMATVIAAGAGNLPAVLAHSDNTTVSQVRTKRMPYLDSTDPNAYEYKLRQTILVDPLYFSDHVNTDAVFMVINKTDTTVPTENQMELWNSFRNPKYDTISGDHTWALVAYVLGGMFSATEYFQARFWPAPSAQVATSK